MTAPSATRSTAPLVAFGSEHEGTGWWKFILDSGWSRTIFVAGGAIELYQRVDSAYLLVGSGAEYWDYTDVLAPGIYYLYAEGGIAFGYGTATWGEYVDEDVEYWSGGEVVHNLWIASRSSSSSADYTDADIIEALTDAFNVSLVGATSASPDSFVDPQSYATALTSPGTVKDLVVTGRQTAIGSSAAGALDDFWPHLPAWPEGAIGMEAEGEATYLGEASLTFGYDISTGSSTPGSEDARTFDATHYWRIGGFALELLRLPGDPLVEHLYYDPAGTTIWSSTGLGAGGGTASIDVSSFADPVTGELTLKSASVVDSIPPLLGPEYSSRRTAYALWGSISFNYRCRAPRVRYQRYSPVLDGELPPVPEINGQLKSVGRRFKTSRVPIW